MQMCSLNKVQMGRGTGRKDAGKSDRVEVHLRSSKALKLFSPYVWMRSRVGSDCSNLRER